MSNMAAIDSVTELGNLLESWEQENGSGADQLPVLTRIAELMERETEHYLKMDPDPFDDRHPGRADPVCTFGHLLKALFKNDNFMNKLVNNYLLNRDNKELSCAACRLLLDIMPGLETSVVFPETEGLVDQLFQWAENANEPLRSYATGLLAAAMNIQDLTGNYKDQNSLLIPIMLQRLHDLRKEESGESESAAEKSEKDAEAKKRPFAHLGDEPDKHDANHSNASKKHMRLRSPPGPNPTVNESSESSWAEMEPLVIGSHQMYPLTAKMQQRLILQYLTSMGEYQEMLGYCFEHDSLNLILHYIRLRENSDVRLAFEALKYLAALLCHKKFAIEFINVGGLQRLLEVYRPSIAATGVSMCLYYLAYNEDAMERVCLLPSPILYDLVKYSLWLLECSHDSGRCHATMFFSLSFQFRAILDYFDAQDGLRKLFNVISTLEIFSVEEPISDRLSDDDVFAKRQTARQVCVALKRYYEAHLAVKAEQLRRSHCRNMGISPQQNSVPAFKAAKFSPEKIQANMDTLLEMMPVRMNWAPVDELHRLSGITLLLQLIGMSYDWNYSGRSETIRSILDVLTVCSVMPKTQLSFCEYVPLPDNLKAVGIGILLGAAEGEVVSDPDVQRSALNVIVNCVCGPTSRLGGLIGRVIGSSSRKQTAVRSPEDLLTNMWNCMRANNGIMVLLNVLMVKTPITDADSIRALACKALVGLSRSEIVKQIISKLPLFTSGHLQALMREPLLQDKRQEHIKFCKYALQLIEHVTDNPLATGIDSSIAKINKANVVAQTKIIYNEKELMQLIHQHLCNKGLTETASLLQKEAALPASATRNGFSNFSISTRHFSTPAIHRIPRFGHGSSTPPVGKNLFGSSGRPSPMPPPPPFASPGASGAKPTGSQAPCESAAIRLSLAGSSSNRSPVLAKTASPKAPKSTVLQKSQMSSGDYQQSPIMKKHRPQGPCAAVPPSAGAAGATVTLDSIVTEYLRKQHALCKNPVATCPPFDLFVPHQCPDPKFINTAPTNFTSRIQRRSINPSYGGVGGAKLDRKLLYSRFRPARTYRDVDDDGCFTCCTFSACQEFLMLGNSSGKLKVYRIETGQEEVTYNCHHSGLMRCEPSKDGKLMLTSSTWRRPLSALWSLGELFEMEYSFEDDHHVEFSKLSQDRIVGTKDETAHVYDVTTGQLLLTLKEPEMCNNYTKNRATFNPTDELVLSDGVLWDIRAAKAIYKFDKFNPHISGVFHPNGLEIIANSEIWDLRSFHLLHTVPALDQCQITFNFKGDVIFGAIGEEAVEMEDHRKSPFGSSFRTFDASDYSNIATIDIRKNIYDMCTDKSDCVVAIIENQGIRDDVSSESICRLYEVGRLRAEDDDPEDDDEEDDDDDHDDDDDDDDLDNSDDGAESIVETINEDGDDDDGDDNDDDEEYGFDGEISGSMGSFRDDSTTDTDSEDSDFTIDDDEEDEDADEDDDILFSLND